MIRTGYSFRTAFGKLADVSSRIKEIGWRHAPITDRCSTFAFNRWSQICKTIDLRPIFGVEIAVTTVVGDKKPIADYWKFLAIDELRPVHDLIYRATQDRETPCLTYTETENLKGVIKIAGERVILDQLRDKDDTFISLDPSTPHGLYLEAKRHGYSFVAGQCNYYPRAADKEVYRVALGARSSTHTYPTHIVSDEEWFSSVPGSDEEKTAALAIRHKIFERCRAKMKKATILVPEKLMTLREMCEIGAAKRGINLEDPVYSERLDRELKLIKEKEFEDYFYLVADVIQYAKTKMIVGPARGSSCGSLVCYLLEITDVDPIPWDLIFERFIDVTRKDFPDIDTDFSEDKRHLVFEYVERKYGKEHVARLGTVSMFQSKSALNAIGAAIKIPKWMIDKVSASVIIRSKGDSRADLKVTDTLKETDAGKEMMESYPEAEIVGQMEDHPVNAGQHAAGLVMTNRSVLDYVAIDARNNAAMCDWQDAKDINLLKVDVLGLTQLSIFERCLELMGKPYSWLKSVPLDDPDAFAILNERKFSGIFQMGPTQQNVAIEVETTELEDIVAMTALCRPGPIGSGATRAWIERRNGRQRVTVDHDLLEPYLRKTLGVPIYQEQTLRIGREVGDLSWEDVTELRKSMSKSLGKEFFNKFGDPWKAGAIAKGMPPATASFIWEKLCSYGTYNFNRSHAVAYAIISYWTMYLKAHHPLEFAAATLDAENEPIRQIQILRELRDEGVSYIPVDPDRSVDRWIVDKNSLIGPLTSIKHIGPVTMRKILDLRITGNPVPESIRKKLVNAKTEIDSLYPVSDAIKRICPDLKSMNIVSKPTEIKKIQPGKINEVEPVMILCQIVRLHPLDENEPGRVAKRGKRVNGPTKSVNFFVRDDTGEIFCKISRWDYERLASRLLNNTVQGKSLFAIKGNCPKDFRMLWVHNIKYIGEPIV